jgi:hypothetical protein
LDAALSTLFLGGAHGAFGSPAATVESREFGGIGNGN